MWEEIRRHRNFLWIALSTVVIIAVYWQSYASMIDMWSLNAYGYAWLVYPVFVYLLWYRRRQIQAAVVKFSWVGFALTIVAVIVWRIATSAGIQIVEFLAAVWLTVAVVWSVLGSRVTSAAIFPLLILTAAVPLGDALIPYLMQVTADISSLMLNVFGVPAYREQMFLTLPGAQFEVARVCGGLRYLLAGVLITLLFAYFNYSSNTKRVVAVLAAAVMFIVANGLRAFIVMYVAWRSEMRLFVGHDHVVFGMIFFAVLMLGFLWIAGRFVDTNPQALEGEPREMGLNQGSISPIASAVFLVVLAGPAANAYMDNTVDPNVSSRRWPQLADCGGPGDWSFSWMPDFKQADAVGAASYTCADTRIGAYQAIYVLQEQGKELITSSNRITPKAWRRSVAEKPTDLRIADSAVPVREIYLSNEQRPDLLIWYWYRIGEKRTNSPVLAKLHEAYNALILRHAQSSVIVLAAEGRGDREDLFVVLQSVAERMLREPHGLEPVSR